MTDTLPPSIDGQLISINDLNEFHYASDFSGMECGSYSITNLFDAKLIHHWLCDNNVKVLNFLQRNFPKVHGTGKIFTDVRRRPLGAAYRMFDLYLAGPPCQGFSSQEAEET